MYLKEYPNYNYKGENVFVCPSFKIEQCDFCTEIGGPRLLFVPESLWDKLLCHISKNSTGEW